MLIVKFSTYTNFRGRYTNKDLLRRQFMESQRNEITETDNSSQERESDIFEAFTNSYAVENCDRWGADLGEDYESNLDDADSLTWENQVPSIDD